MRRAAVAALAGAVVAAPTGAWAMWAAVAAGGAAIGADTMSNPTGFTVACAGAQRNSAMNLSWTPSPDTYVTGYRIVRTSAAGAVVELPLVSGRMTSTATSSPATKDTRPVTYTFTIQALSSTTTWSTAPTPAAASVTYVSNGCG